MSAKPTARPGRRRALRGVGFTLLSVLVLAGLAHGLAWFWLTGVMTVALSDWVTLQRARGWDVEHELPQRAGWPFSARLVVPGVRIAGWTPTLPQGFVWDAERVELSIGPPRIDRLLIAASGQQRIASGGVTVPYTAARLELLLPLDQRGGQRPAELLLQGLQAMTPSGPLAAERIEARATPGSPLNEPGLGLWIEAWRMTLPPVPDAAAFGRQIAHASIDARLTGLPPPPVPLSPRDMAQAWRAGGGALDLRELSLRWGPLAGTLRAVLRLDAALQPAGSGDLVLEQPAAAVAALAGAGMIESGTATAAQAVLGMMARPPADGGTPRVDVPFGVEGGVVTVARFPLLRLRPLVWPEQVPYQR
ncbi:DUF2125 domain-containing protein [Roseomonas terrae]|uniref:DUF2125 domain-containing protein n=1 Tax=Neoroseomonas terrae TaxID=424799 RepID=A0ABS5EDQ5_9PROT|nr:DUF2125 domain-containing protein [Neoroseomonas terrae]MBR0649157.1 DUF2125 domain-containing protein [Neoroseomonas terrae]